MEWIEVPIQEVWQGTESCAEEGENQECLAHGEMQKSFGTKEGVQRRGRREGRYIMALEGLLMLCVHPERRTQQSELGVPTHQLFAG